MKDVMIKFAVISAFAFSMPVTATGLVAIPATGFSGTAYTLCNNTGNFGSSISSSPSASSNNTCAVFPTNEAASPVTGYTIIASTHRQALINGTLIGSVLDRVWRNSAQTSCIFGTSFSAANVDWDASRPGTQYFVVNDIARGGFGNIPVNAGYSLIPVNASPVYRIGRTFTSVQHRAFAYDTAVNKFMDGTNYLDLPTSNSVNTALTGEPLPINSVTHASTSLTTQDAVVNSNWIDFTVDAAYQDEDGSTHIHTGMVYVEAPCDSTSVTGWTKTGAIRLRQTGQENTTMQEIIINGYAPPSAIVP